MLSAVLKSEIVILDCLNEPKESEQGIFDDGQIFDAYAFIAKLIKKQKNG